MKYNHYVWFDGDQAFRTVAGVLTDNLEDQYKLSTAYRSDGQNGKKVELLGAMQEPVEILENMYGLQDDVAVLRVYPPPPDAVPIPLGVHEPGKSMSKGTSVFALGFPHGRKSIEGDTVVSRCTDGTISRVFDNVLATNADLHPGNSGGPAIDLDGFAIGITSACFVSRSGSNTPTSQNSMGWIYPIQNARLFLDSVRVGNPQWKGMPTYTFEAALDKARSTALAGNSAAATQIMDSLIAESPHPDLYFWAGILSAKGDYLTDGGKSHLKNALKLEPRNMLPRFLLYRADFLAGVPETDRACRADLAALDWRHSQDLMRYLMQILEGGVPAEKAAESASTPEEEAFIHWTAASLDKLRGNQANYHRHLLAAYAVAEQGSPLDFLIQSELKQNNIHPKIDRQPPSATETDGWESLETVLNRLLEEKQPTPQQPEVSNSRATMIQEAFDFTTKGLWPKALARAEQYLAMPGRESANTLGMGLLRCQLLYLIGDKQKAENDLKEYSQKTHDPWYQRLSDGLLGTVSEESLRAEAMNSREKTITLAIALGLKAEADGEKSKAIEYYNDALDTGMINWLEFGLAIARRESIRSAI